MNRKQNGKYWLIIVWDGWRFLFFLAFILICLIVCICSAVVQPLFQLKRISVAQIISRESGGDCVQFFSYPASIHDFDIILFFRSWWLSHWWNYHWKFFMHSFGFNCASSCSSMFLGWSRCFYFCSFSFFQRMVIWSFPCTSILRFGGGDSAGQIFWRDFEFVGSQRETSRFVVSINSSIELWHYVLIKFGQSLSWYFVLFQLLVHA